jgi:hypothetical protein
MVRRYLVTLVIVVAATGFSPVLPAQVADSPAGHGRAASHQSVFASMPMEHPSGPEDEHSQRVFTWESRHFDDEDDHEHYDFDYLQPLHHRHETLDGYPIFELLRTDHAFIERKVRVDFVDAAHVGPDNVHQSDFNFELFWAINNRMAFVVEAPLTLLDPQTGPFASGIGDLEAGVRLIAFDGRYDIVTCGLNVATPTGDPDRDLGEGRAGVEPVFLWWHDMGCGWVAQSEVAWEIPVDGDEPESEMRYNLGLSKTLSNAADWPVFNYLTPLIEVNGLTPLDGNRTGATVIDLTPGFRWAVTEEDHAGFGCSVPITGERHFSSQFIFSFIHHF